MAIVAVLKTVRQIAEPAFEHASVLVPAIVVDHVPELATIDTHCKARHGAEVDHNVPEIDPVEGNPVLGCCIVQAEEQQVYSCLQRWKLSGWHAHHVRGRRIDHVGPLDCCSLSCVHAKIATDFDSGSAPAPVLVLASPIFSLP
jgi:hypothetical protein